MNQQRSQGQMGYITVDVEAEHRMGDLPEWLDTRMIVDAALTEYRRQRDEAVGALPTRATEEAF